MMFEFEDACPRCGANRLRSWHELSEEEREVVRRLYGVDANEERGRRLRWCVRCWHEETNARPRNV